MTGDAAVVRMEGGSIDRYIDLDTLTLDGLRAYHDLIVTRVKEDPSFLTNEVRLNFTKARNLIESLEQFQARAIGGVYDSHD